MIQQFEEFLNENKVQLPIGSDTIDWKITENPRLGKLVAMASSGKDLDKLVDSGASETAIAKDLEDGLNKKLKKLKQDITLKLDYNYQGGGYAFDIDLSNLIKRISK